MFYLQMLNLKDLDVTRQGKLYHMLRRNEPILMICVFPERLTEDEDTICVGSIVFAAVIGKIIYNIFC